MSIATAAPSIAGHLDIATGVEAPSAPPAPVSVWYSRFLKPQYAKLHVDRGCAGLETTPPECVVKSRCASPRAMLVNDRRPCRMCALETASVDVLRRPISGRAVWLSLASVPSERLGDGVAELSTSGTSRLERVAAATSCQLIATPVGPVLVAATTWPVAKRLGNNLASLVVPRLSSVPFEVPESAPLSDVLSAAWSLSQSRPKRTVDSSTVGESNVSVPIDDAALTMLAVSLAS